jgi:multicomponent Na+:H+ antiporter subunit A
MVGLVVSDHLVSLYVFWELTSVTSYLLIGWTDREAKSRAAALQAILVTGAGGLALLAGLILLGQAAGTYRLSELLADPPSGTTITVALVLVLLGAFTKSAQAPFSFWLPGAMAAPTPISAYLHSATMVKAGVFLVARFAPAFAEAGLWRPVVLTVGLVTMVLGGVRAVRQFDLKLLLAFGTVSQLGFMMVLVGAGTGEATTAGMAMILGHGLFKAALFMVVGIIDHQAHTRDLRALSLTGRPWRPLLVVSVFSAASMAGIPLWFGFIAKESAYEAFTHGDAWAGVVLAGIVIGSIFTVAYSARFVWGAFRKEPGVWPDGPEPVVGAKPPSLTFLAPAIPLVVLTVLLGVLPALADGLVNAAAQAADPLAEAVHLKIWHGVNLALVLSAVTLATGVVLFLAHHPVSAFLSRLPSLPQAGEAYLSCLRALNVVANRTTAVVQSGSLPVYAGVILLTTAIIPGTALLGLPWPGWPAFAGGWVLFGIAVLLAGGAVVVASSPRRFAAALALGTVGYGMALLFVVKGAPDLALTQFAIETLSVVLFVLVLRFLPDRFGAHRRSPAVVRVFRLAVAGTVGVVVTAFLIVSSAARTQEPISAGMIERSLPEGGGRNVVNVILVDFRGLDTLGEITVLAVAAIGALSLTGASISMLLRRRKAVRV